MIGNAVLVYVFLAMALGWAASTRGRSGPGFFALALVTTPVIAAIVLVVSKGPNEVDVEPTLSEEIARLAELRDAGELTPDEFARAKAALLGPTR